MKPEVELLEPQFLQLWQELGIKHVIGGNDAFMHMVNSYSNLAFCKTATLDEYHEFVYCSMILDLYQLLGKKSWIGVGDFDRKFGTDFLNCGGSNSKTGLVTWFKSNGMLCFGGVWFAKESDRLHALSLCGIDKSFQEKCAKLGLGGA